MLTQGIVRNEPVGEINQRFLRSAATHERYKESFTAGIMKVLDLKPTDYLLKSIDRSGLREKLEQFFE